MGKTTIMPYLFLCFLPCLFFSVESKTGLVPALYLFGDSLLDAGNNNNFITQAKANYPPYGIDFPAGASGRFTNGYTMADYLAIWLGIAIPPPFIHPESLFSDHLGGFNYASGSSGILPETGSLLGTNLCMRKQVMLFRNTVEMYLPLYYESANELAAHLSKSIFVIFIGSNDYMINYLLPQFSRGSNLYNPLQFAELLVVKLANHILELYAMGARKFVLAEIGPIGCIPYLVNEAKPKLKTRCVESVNSLILIFNKKFAAKVDELRSTLPRSTFIIANIYHLSYDLVVNPSHYGLTDSRNPCCIVPGDGMGACIPLTVPCEDRNLHAFWDSFHPGDASNKILASKCFNGTDLCTPMNVLQLAQEP